METMNTPVPLYSNTTLATSFPPTGYWGPPTSSGKKKKLYIYDTPFVLYFCFDEGETQRDTSDSIAWCYIC
jgi:hypothetical protein